jgi:hypothetical protein
VTLPALAVVPLTRVSRLPYHWRGDRYDLTALSGQAATFSRAATATPADVNGTTRTVVHSQPAWQHEDWDGDATRDTPCLLMGTSDKCYWSMLAPPEAGTWSVEFVERGTLATASDAIAYIGNAGNTGARLWIDSTGTFYRVRHHNGTAEVTSTISSGAPTAGQRVIIRVVLASTGSVQIFQSINGAAETSGSASATNALATAWSDTRLYLGTTGDTNAGSTAFVRARMYLGGTLTAAQMLETW